MNKKAIGKITVIFWALCFIILWALVLSGLVSSWGAAAVNNNGLTGIEALILENLNLLVLVLFFIFLVAVSFSNGGQ